LELAPFIRELILHNECIILPGFGGFETEYTPATYDSLLHVMLPPSKKIFFKPEYSSGGEILEKYLSSKLRLKQDQVRLIIENYVATLKLKLENGEKVILGGIGVFQSDMSGNITFTQLKEENYLAESFGLEPLPVKSTKKGSSKPEKHTPVIVVSGRSNTLRFVIVGVVVISILLTITIILSSKFNLYIFNIGDKTSREEIILGGSSLTDTSLSKINQEIEEYTTVKQALSISPEHKADNPKLKPFFIVAGSFNTFKNASGLETTLKREGYKPTIIKFGTDYKVCLGRFADRISADKEMNRLQSQLEIPLTILSTDKN
jgi:hypothetical protein